MVFPKLAKRQSSSLASLFEQPVNAAYVEASKPFGISTSTKNNGNAQVNTAQWEIPNENANR